MNVWLCSSYFQTKNTNLSDANDHHFSIPNISLYLFCDASKIICFYCIRVHFLRNIHLLKLIQDNVFSEWVLLMLMGRTKDLEVQYVRLFILIIEVGNDMLVLLLHLHMNDPLTQFSFCFYNVIRHCTFVLLWLVLLTL